MVSYAYDELNRKVGMTYPDGSVVNYVYDEMNRLTGVMQEGEEIAAYAYDAAGRRVETRIAKSAVSAGEAALITTYAYDAVGNLTHQETSGDTVLSLAYAYNLNGQITRETRTEQGKATVSDYAYDALNQLTAFTQSTGYAESYAYDKAGNMTQKVITPTGGAQGAADVITLTMKYNKGNQLTEMQNGKSTITYRYDKNGSLVETAYGKMTDTYAYDALGYLESYRGYDGYTQSYTTNAQGLRMSKTETGEADDTRLTLEERLAQGLAPEVGSESETSNTKTTTDYIYDFTLPYGQVIAETTTQGKTKTATNYIYGMERIAGVDTQTQAQTQYVYDVRGSVVQSVTTAPEAPKPQVQSYAYTPFGEQLGGVKVSGFGYNAEAYDAATGMLNLRARQYEPAMNRFSQKDILRGSVAKPISLNRYAFVVNDPVMFADPNGEANIPVCDGGSGYSSQEKRTAEAIKSAKAKTAAQEAAKIYVATRDAKNRLKSGTATESDLLLLQAQDELDKLDKNDPNYEWKHKALVQKICSGNIVEKPTLGDTIGNAVDDALNVAGGAVMGAWDILIGNALKANGERFNEAMRQNTLYAWGNYLTSGWLGNVNGAINPEKPLSVQHWGDSFSAVSPIMLPWSYATKAGAMPTSESLRQYAQQQAVSFPQQDNSVGQFGNRIKLDDHYNKHGDEFRGIYDSADEYLQGAREVMKNGIKVQYNYKDEIRNGYVKYMGNNSKGQAKFEFVGTNGAGTVTTYHVESGKTFWKMLNGENIPVINPVD